MKRITVGRGYDCDVLIADETDNVSRHHMVITFNFFGKMKVSDTSSNGTSINGVRMLKGVSIPVTRDDTIRLGKSVELDWSRVNDPYRSMRLAILLAVIILIIAGVGIGVWSWYMDRPGNVVESPEIEMTGSDVPAGVTWNQDSTAKVAPTITSIDVKGEKNTSPQTTGRKKKGHKKVNKSEKKAMPAVKQQDANSELDSVAVF